MTICKVLEISPYDLLGETEIHTQVVDMASMEGRLWEALVALYG